MHKHACSICCARPRIPWRAVVVVCVTLTTLLVGAGKRHSATRYARPSWPANRKDLCSRELMTIVFTVLSHVVDCDCHRQCAPAFVFSEPSLHCAFDGLDARRLTYACVRFVPASATSPASARTSSSASGGTVSTNELASSLHGVNHCEPRCCEWAGRVPHILTGPANRNAKPPWSSPLFLFSRFAKRFWTAYRAQTSTAFRTTVK